MEDPIKTQFESCNNFLSGSFNRVATPKKQNALLVIHLVFFVNVDYYGENLQATKFKLI